jgi:hypothetical protein
MSQRSPGRWWIVAAFGTLLVAAAAIGIVQIVRHPGEATGPPAAAAVSASGAPAASGVSAGPPAEPPGPTPTPPRLLFGIGAEADSAMSAPLTHQAPVWMLSSWYNGPSDLSWLSGWRSGTVPRAYAAGYALHLIVFSGGSAVPVFTRYGLACGRPYPLSSGFAADMSTLAQIFAGGAHGPPLYVTMFTELQTYPCRTNAWSPDAATTHYYQALQDQYRLAYSIFHRYAPNSRVSLGWGGWQARYDDPAIGGGRSLFTHFADVMKMSDFQSFQAMDNSSNAADITAMVSILGRYGPVMLAHYKPNNGSQSTFDADVHTILTDAYLGDETHAGLFAMSFMDSTNLARAASLDFVTTALARFGKSW